MNLKGFPHSDIPGSKLVCSSPGLFAAYRVLHRLLAPRHSPYALSSLTTSVFALTLDGIRDPGSGTREPSSPIPATIARQHDLFSHCVLPGSPKAARDRNREPPQGGLQIACSKRTTVCRIFSCQRSAECFTNCIQLQTHSW